MKNKGNSLRKIRPILAHLFNFFKIKFNRFKIINFLRRFKFYNSTGSFFCIGIGASKPCRPILFLVNGPGAVIPQKAIRPGTGCRRSG